jgi:PTH2 family peptidyl-tRNA hydrolase
VHDAGRTQVPAGTPTCAAIGPATDEAVDAVTGDLRLL